MDRPYVPVVIAETFLPLPSFLQIPADNKNPPELIKARWLFRGRRGGVEKAQSSSATLQVAAASPASYVCSS